MKLQGRNLSSRMEGDDVKLLQQELSILYKAGKLDIQIDQTELARKYFGTTTRRAVIAFQQQHHLPATGIVDEPTARAINAEVDALQPQTFTVSGKTLRHTGEAAPRQQLYAFDVDLRGAAIYRTVQKLTELKEHGGFEPLAELSSDRKGRYKLTFTSELYKEAERKYADVIVFAVEGDEITGRSRLVKSSEYSDKGEMRNLDIIITRGVGDKTEYGLLMPKLNRFLKESKVALVEMVSSPDQIAFTAQELDEAPKKIQVAVRAESLRSDHNEGLSHELFYGIGRQQIHLSWPSLYRKKNGELKVALEKSIREKIIGEYTSDEIEAFLQQIHRITTAETLKHKGENQTTTLDEMLSYSLPNMEQRTAFLESLRDFDGDYEKFWKDHLPNDPAFKDNPGLISGILFTNQLTLISDNHQPLVEELQKKRKLKTSQQLLELSTVEWKKILRKTGVPEHITGKDEEEKTNRYTEQIQNMLHAAYPTQKVALMVKTKEFPIKDANVAEGVSVFISNNEKFDFAGSRIQEFEKEIKDASPEHHEKVMSELFAMQRIFQVSPNPHVMSRLQERELNSANAIASIPGKSFIKMYGDIFGGAQYAQAVHQRATFINTRCEHIALKMQEMSHGATPKSAMSQKEYDQVMTELKNQVPNYSNLFGSPDICECKHCRSVYSPAAYLVDLLRFLWRGEPNYDNKSPLDMLKKRRPDLLRLPLTCENTNTVIPYIDLANEVMEYYTANGALYENAAHDTGETTAEELRANPQYSDMEAYRKLKDTVYPFTLPYHQPLDVIRTYTDHLNVSRSEVMKAMNPEPDAVTTKAIEAESLIISPEEYTLLTGEAFDGTTDSTPLHEYFGYANALDFANMQKEKDSDGNPGGIRVLLERTGLAYTDLVELVKKPFINPWQGTLYFLEKIFSYTSIDASSLYAKLGQIEAGTLDPADDADIVKALNDYNSDNGTSITTSDFAQWVTDHFSEFRQIITLYEPQSKCDLKTTQLRTIQSIYEGLDTSGITYDSWSKIHRFIRLWRKLGWTIQETDLMLAALGENDITTGTISKLESVSLLSTGTRRPLNQLAVLWGNIDTCGDKSLYKKLFLNKAVQQIDDAFKDNAWGNCLADESELLKDHIPALLAAFRVNSEDLQTIFRSATITDNNAARPISLKTDTLNLANISTIYRFVVLAKALRFRVSDLCLIIRLFNAEPFSSWDVQQKKFVNISPANTFDFYELAADIKKAGFKPATLQYIFTGNSPAESTLALSNEKAMQTAKAIRTLLFAIEQDHPETPATPLTSEMLGSKLSLTFQPEVVDLFIGIIEDTSTFTTITEKNLTVIIPVELAEKYSYIKGSGRLSCTGIMTDSEKNALGSLDGASPDFVSAVNELYKMPENYIGSNFYGLFAGDMSSAIEKLLNHPEQVSPPTHEEKTKFVYENYLPLLKKKLREDVVTQQIADIIGLSEVTTAALIKKDLEQLIENLGQAGYSAVYFKDIMFSAPGLERIDSEINFMWSDDVPDPLIPADQFSVRWEALAAPPESAEYTLVVEVQQADESFSLYVDDAIILQKATGNTTLSWEVVVSLNASQLYHFKLEYADMAQEAGIKLSWKTPTTAVQVIPFSAVFPASVINHFIAATCVYHRAAKFISGFELNEVELDHLILFSSDFSNINFKALLPEHWVRINDYVKLRNALPRSQATLVDVFAEANKTYPAPALSTLETILNKTTAWDAATIHYLINTHLGLTIDDFKNEIALSRIHEMMRIISKTGISAEILKVWDLPDSSFNELEKWDNWNEKAQLIKRMVKAKYEEADWLQLAGGLSDRVRENQKQALIQYLLMQSELRDWGVKDADSLFEYFLIDVQMGACMDTSRIKQANSSIQLFVARCLLNLESDRTSGEEKGVSPEFISKERWEWMKNYRVWEANRKVFLYPENWLEPEWRDDRSPFFKELESELVQNDITEKSVENAFRNYLGKLNEVANLEVCGMYEDTDTEMIHVFARTHNIPYQYCYRTWNKYMKWSAWEKVQLDIRSVDDGDNSGVHLIPVVWKKSLFLFWPEFMEKQEEAGVGSLTIQDAAMNTIDKLKSTKYWNIYLAWSEYVDGKWTPKQLTKEFIRPSIFYANVSKYTFQAFISSNNELSILYEPFDDKNRQKFQLSDIRSKVETPIIQQLVAYDPYSVFDFQKIEVYSPFDVFQLYSNYFMKHQKKFKLNLKNNTYLQSSANHKLLYSHQHADFESTLKYPFFYLHEHRTYFVRPVDIRVVKLLRTPERFKPVVIDLVADDILLELDIPQPTVPEDYKLGDILVNPVPADAAIAEIDETLVNKCNNMVTQRSFNNPAPYGNVPAYGVMKTMSRQSSHMNMADSHKFAQAFGGTSAKNELGHEKGLEFHTFYHPFSSKYTKRLNQYGMEGLMTSDTSIKSDDGDTFNHTYKPNFNRGLVVPSPLNLDDIHTYYQENVCFDVYGANSIYNWELFFHAPLYIATRLSKNGKFAEAMQWFHYIFDPTTDEMPLVGQSETSRYWKVLPFKTTPVKTLQEWFGELKPNSDPNFEPATGFAGTINEWRDKPFRPHLVARNRPLAYMKHVVFKYVENLVDWGDQLFRRDTMESINEATQLYVMASHILGPRPEFVPKRGKIKTETYASLASKLDDFSNAVVQLENIFPYSSGIPVANSEYSGGLLGIGPALYFCIPNNEKLLTHWDTVADRLFKIRHCMNIDGVERRLALFEPPIDPGMLIKAFAQGLSLGDILSDLSSPPPIYRFSFLIQKATEFCAEVKSLGAALLSTLEKKDSEELGRTRATHETTILKMMTSIKERQFLEAKAGRESLLKSRETAIFRLRHYTDLLGNDSITISSVPQLSSNLTADSQLPADTIIPTIETDVDESLVDSDESGVKLIPRESEELEQSEIASDFQDAANVAETIGSALYFIPDFTVAAEPFGIGANVIMGGKSIGAAASAVAKGLSAIATMNQYDAQRAGKLAGYIRREQDWTLQVNLAAKEIIQLDKQITASDIRMQSAKIELKNHLQQIDNAKYVESFLKDKFTNQELYQWMKEQIYAVYKQSYNMAYNMAKKAEKAYVYEIGNDMASFIQYGYWDNSYQGLMSGERLHLALKQLDKAYIEENKRELELTKHISLALLNPLVLQELKETGKCFVTIPEELFDLDFQGHYFRRIKSVSLSIPCIVGPYNSVNCSLRLLKNTIRINTSMNNEGNYEHNNDEGVWIDDMRFRSSSVPVKSIATSSGQNDAGMFELNFRDERYLPFEGAGAISEWKIELTTDKDLRQFDYSTISDIIISLNYTAREDLGLFRKKALEYIKNFLVNAAELRTQPLMRMFSMKHEFPTEWHRFLYPATEGAEQVLSFTIGKERFPFFAQDRKIVVMMIEVFAKCTQEGDYHMVLSYIDSIGDIVISPEDLPDLIALPQNDTYGGLNKATINVNDAGLNLEALDITGEMNLKMKYSTAPDYTSLATEPGEVEDIFLVFHYKLETES